MEKNGNESHHFDAFPYKPYAIQTEFMKQLYDTLNLGGVGLFESPTGTGKTMSLICGSLHWLEANDINTSRTGPLKQGSGEGGSDDDIPDWMIEFGEKQSKEQKRLLEEKRAKRIEKGRMKLKEFNAMEEPMTEENEENSDEEFLIESQKPDGILTGKKRPLLVYDSSSSDDDIQALACLDEANDDEGHGRTQIIFCSRTHSQLMQFVGELNKTRFKDRMSLVSLGARKSLCINPAVRKLQSNAMINEKCIDLQNSKRKQKGKESATSQSKCIYLQRGSKSASIMRDMILAQPMDIEELASLGAKRSTCPYYAAREAAQESDIILAPYSALLVKDTRESLGLRVKDNIIIIDEAHNLVDAINGSHSATLSAAQIEDAKQQLEHYLRRFRNRLSPTNAQTVETLIRIALSIQKFYEKEAKRSGSRENGNAFTINDFVFDAGMDHINMFQVGGAIKENNFIYKISGFWKSYRLKCVENEDGLGTKAEGRRSGEDPGTAATHMESHHGGLQALLEFVKKLTFEDHDGRIIFDRDNKVIKYVLLNARSAFEGIVKDAKAVVLASGTLSPLETVLPLFQGDAKKTILKYSCGHIVDKERLLALVLPSGPSGKLFDFRHAQRKEPEMIMELGRTLLNISAVTPGGIVVFLPSFVYLDQVLKIWQANGMFQSLQVKKKVFSEPRTAAQVDPILAEYAQCIAEGKEDRGGAIMLAIVGGKLSEGINFGDDMGRCIVMVGLPYPNPSDPELQERMRFMDKRCSDITRGLVRGITTSVTGKEYYSNLCMNAVNQCIGRAIRHKNDYAAIILMDHRYTFSASLQDGTKAVPSGITCKLSKWILQSLIQVEKFGEAQGRLSKFFRTMHTQ